MRLVWIGRDSGLWSYWWDAAENDYGWELANSHSHFILLVTVESAREDYNCIVPARTAVGTP